MPNSAGSRLPPPGAWAIRGLAGGSECEATREETMTGAALGRAASVVDGGCGPAGAFARRGGEALHFTLLHVFPAMGGNVVSQTEKRARVQMLPGARSRVPVLARDLFTDRRVVF